MTSHSELQEAMERLQTDMGQKESELNLLRKDKWVYQRTQDRFLLKSTAYREIPKLSCALPELNKVEFGMSPCLWWTVNFFRVEHKQT